MSQNIDSYIHKFRKEEINTIFTRVPNKSLGIGLELGAGDGYQSVKLSEYLLTLYCTEYTDEKLIRRNIPNVKYSVCDAENLPFEKSKFDFIFSSNLLEHLQRRNKALESMNKVLRDNGLMIHIMPNRAWKIFLFLLYYPHLLNLLLNYKNFKKKLNTKIKKDIDPNNPKKKQSKSRFSFIKYLLPQIHGEYSSHLAEFIDYGNKKWIDLFTNNGFEVVKIIKDMPFVSGYNLGFDRTRALFRKIGISSSYAYIVIKKGHQSPLLKYFK